MRQTENAFLIGILGDNAFRHHEAAKFLQYFRQWHLIVGRLSQYVEQTDRNDSRKSSVSLRTAEMDIGGTSGPALLSAVVDGARIRGQHNSVASSTASTEAISFILNSTDDSPPNVENLSSPDRLESTCGSMSFPWLLDDSVTKRLSVANLRSSSEGTSDESQIDISIHSSIDPIQEIAQEQIVQPLYLVLGETSLFELMRRLQAAGPRTAENDGGWDVSPDDAPKYQQEVLRYLRLVPVHLPLAKGEENLKLCSWGCTFDEGMPTLLSSSRSPPPTILAECSTLRNHMAGIRSCRPCHRIPSLVKAICNKREFRTVRPIRNIIEIYYRVTREAGSSNSGRYTALRATGASLNSRYNDLPEL